ncbi:GDP-mannose 4,6-dehydratase [Candidatus Methanoplasma termitum]|uniref:Gmd protein n=1 Tax=Candidatus Methanoplasma termitum TaxID=1577791 RepID=A0A0A7LDF1_9ARCH|nr:NAD-dependent epimerase/dehydratase family protein [Candidatus Methanoplasma termitum]AIZ57023.1 GDP-mannose 4,6-dehydratase [Candidatus Methanoplasma termitum]
MTSGKAVISGGAGFIGSHLADSLLKRGWDVVATDRIPAQNASNIKHLVSEKRFVYVENNMKYQSSVNKLTEGADMIFHLAANSDIQKGGRDPSIDLNDTFLTTVSMLEAARVNGIRKFFFSSTSAVYGDIKGKLNEETGGLQPISFYGAAKLASEAMISSYSYMNDIDSLVFRFPNVVGPRLTHGVIFDFIKKLKANPKKLEILGNGKQSKQYVYVKDLADGIADFSSKIEKGYNLYNISTNSFTTVNEIANMVCERMGLSDVRYEYTGGDCGWKGDVPTFDYDVKKAEKKGWKYNYDSSGSVRKTLEDINISADR